MSLGLARGLGNMHIQQIARSKVVVSLVAVIISIMIIVPVLINLLFIYKFGVNCVYQDQWEVVPLFDKFYSGNLSLKDLLAWHVDHRPAVPRLVMLGLGALTHYNTTSEMYLSWFLLCLICVILFRLYIRSFGFSRTTMALFIPVIWLVFSLRQYENLLRGDQFSMFLEIFLLLLAIYLLAASKRVDWRFMFAIMCGVFCTFTLGGGLIVWPVGLIQILFGNGMTGKRLYGLGTGKAVSWMIVAFAVYIFYYSDYMPHPNLPDPLYFIHDPGMALRYGLVALGSPLSLDISTAEWLGVILSLLYLFVVITTIIKSKFLTVKFPFISLILFTVAVAAVMVVIRSGTGITMAFTSRYTTMTTMGIIGLYILIITMDIKNTNIKYSLAFLLISLIIVYIGPPAISSYWKVGENIRLTRLTAANYVITYNYQQDESLVQYVYPSSEVARQRIGVLYKYKLNAFSDAILSTEGLTPLNMLPLYHVEVVNNQTNEPSTLLSLTSDNGDSLRLTGWAIDQNVAGVAGGVFINIDGRLEMPAIYGLDRCDVANMYKNDKYRYSGFEARIPASVIGPGRRIVAITVISGDRRSCYLPAPVLMVDVK